MKLKIFLSRILAAALLLSVLTVSAAASPETSYRFGTHGRFEVHPELFLTVTYTEREASPEDPLVYQSMNKTLTVSNFLFAWVAPLDQVYTVINTGSTELTISVLQYVEKSASEIRAEYVKPEVRCILLGELPKNDTPVWFAVGSMEQRSFLTGNGDLSSGYSSADDPEIRKIQPGETVTFTIPNAQYGELYRIFIEPEGSFLQPYYIFIGNSKPIFIDVPDSAYFSAGVEWAVQKNITNGTTSTTFSPNETCTKAQILTFLWRANGCPMPEAANPFSDAAEDAYYRNAAVWAYEKGLIDGEIFDGDAPCTRASVVTYLWKLAGSPDAEASGFADVDSSSPCAAAVGWAVEQGITNGTSETEFSPDMICTRGQIVTLLHRALEK